MPKQPPEKEPKKPRRKSSAVLTVVDGGKTPKAVRSGGGVPVKTGAKREIKPDPKIGVQVGKAAATPKCYESHKPYAVTADHFIHGGSCFRPVKDCDVYVALDGAASITEQSFPWTPGHEIHFTIRDRHAPTSPKATKELVRWLAKQLYDGKTIHVGCIGGHGRTGLILAALRAHMANDENAIEHVRANYCHRAVESEVQVAFLQEHFGCVWTKPSSALSSKFLDKFPSTTGAATPKFQGFGAGELFDKLPMPTVTTKKPDET